MKRSLVAIIGFLSVSSSLVAQQDPQFTQYFENTLFVNPAYAGSKGMLNVTGMHREQWVGFDGAPRSTTLSIHSPLSYESVGLGMTVVNDQVGPMKQTMFYGDFSYSLKFKNNAKLAFGLKAGVNLINIGTSALSNVQNDTYLMQDVRNNVNPNFGFGVYYHTPNWFVGLSTPKLLEQSYDGGTTNIEQRHYFGIAGFVASLSEYWKIRPMTQVKAVEGAPLSIDVSAAFIYNDRFYIGPMWRPNAAVGAFVQFQISPQLKAGLASDFGTQAIRNYNGGTYELMLSYDFNFRKKAILSPRYF